LLQSGLFAGQSPFMQQLAIGMHALWHALYPDWHCPLHAADLSIQAPLQTYWLALVQA
jgi:hypothetical protein